MADQKREELLQSAVKFLKDPNVQSSPLAKKVAFLESKGLTPDEIEDAMARASGKAVVPAAPLPVAGAPAPAPGLYPPAGPYPPGTMVLQAPPVPPRAKYDWRDVFISAVMAGGVGYGVWLLAKAGDYSIMALETITSNVVFLPPSNTSQNLIGPLIQIPTQRDLEDDKNHMDAQFQAAEEALKTLGTQTTAALQTVTRQSEKVSQTLEGVDDVLKQIKERDASRDEEMRAIKQDVDVIKGLVPRMLDRNKDAQATILNDLQQEIKSLKSLLLNRRPTGGPTPFSTTEPVPAVEPTPSTSGALSARLTATLASAGGRPGIPAWQLTAAKGGAGKDTAVANNVAPVVTNLAGMNGGVVNGGVVPSAGVVPASTAGEAEEELVGVEKVEIETVERE
ncbi:peroxisomal membrane anchor protein conserved region-domain-containing protein [Jimgerdemannia flammicorona]|uniref:Peroxisomal membrane anchor protein conserved region-domain-containing protein n=2 Tax=Jimgerdemannia flammicorona TaxID=994334 RepID=A0A433D493_9FUNG|nr:peroxisomal membrane anchor protein conserved region-domain-containing protein [Jimgerdemannia flammicorona]RUS23527.1 peroxisomal membrane anchor protein conserved region-domain-containing protein [Jimgerdemannia flammicorona]